MCTFVPAVSVFLRSPVSGYNSRWAGSGTVFQRSDLKQVFYGCWCWRAWDPRRWKLCRPGQQGRDAGCEGSPLYTYDTTCLAVASPLCQEPHSHPLPSLDDSKYSLTSLQRSCFQACRSVSVWELNIAKEGTTAVKGMQGWRELAGWAGETGGKGEREIGDILEFAVVDEKLSCAGSVT